MESFLSEREVGEMCGLLLEAKNLNSAVKSYLKHETEKSEQEIRVLKALRKVLLPGQKKALENFLGLHAEKHAFALFVLLRHAYFQDLSPVVAQAIEGYAERFNATYEYQGEELRVLDATGFESIVKQVAGLLSENLATRGLADKQVLHRVFLHLLYEPLVIEKAAPIHLASVM
jgi:hypothetical protein